MKISKRFNLTKAVADLLAEKAKDSGKTQTHLLEKALIRCYAQKKEA
jgi:hypothetical protein